MFNFLVTFVWSAVICDVRERNHWHWFKTTTAWEKWTKLLSDVVIFILWRVHFSTLKCFLSSLPFARTTSKPQSWLWTLATRFSVSCVDEHPRKRKSCLFILGIPDVNGVFIVWKIRYAWARRITCEVLTAPPNGFIGSLVLQEFIQQSISALRFVMIPENVAKQGLFFIWRWVPFWTAFMAGPVDWPCMEATMKKCDQGNCRKDCFQIDRKLGFHPDSDTFVSIYKTNLVGPLAWVSGFARRFVMLMGRGP